jgi:hypothetical protein
VLALLPSLPKWPPAKCKIPPAYSVGRRCPVCLLLSWSLTIRLTKRVLNLCSSRISLATLSTNTTTYSPLSIPEHVAAGVPSSNVTYKSPRSPSISYRIMLPFVSIRRSITIFPELPRTRLPGLALAMD